MLLTFGQDVEHNSGFCHRLPSANTVFLRVSSRYLNTHAKAGCLYSVIFEPSEKVISFAKIHRVIPRFGLNTALFCSNCSLICGQVQGLSGSFPCSRLCLFYWGRPAWGCFSVSKYRPAGHLLNSIILFVCFGNSCWILSNFPLPKLKHTHTHAVPPVWCAYEMKTNMGRGVNISKCWLHKKAASENSCRDLRARGFVRWPVQLQPSRGPSLLCVHWARVQIIGWSLSNITGERHWKRKLTLGVGVIRETMIESQPFFMSY